jgi:ABC-type antimicrobial peptide transport system permease subunit
MAMLGSSAGIALLLGLVGIYGVVSYLVSLRTREIGVRMALGATAPSVRRMVVRQGIRLTLGGTVLGLVAAGMMSSVLGSVLFGVGVLDPFTYATVASALVVVAILASWLPAARAAAVEPMQVLREE